MKKRDDPFDRRFHPWPGFPNGAAYCTRCTFKAEDDYARVAERLVERMHQYATLVRTEPHQVGEGYNNLIRMAAKTLRDVSRGGVRAALTLETSGKPRKKNSGGPARGKANTIPHQRLR